MSSKVLAAWEEYSSHQKDAEIFSFIAGIMIGISMKIDADKSDQAYKELEDEVKYIHEFFVEKRKD